MGTDRRGFLKGAFGGVVATGVVVAASAAEVSKFASGIPDGAPLVLPPPRIDLGAGIPELGEILFDYRGNPVAVVRSVDVKVDSIDVTQADEMWRTQIAGFPTVTLTAVCSGAASILMKGAGHHSRR